MADKIEFEISLKTSGNAAKGVAEVDQAAKDAKRSVDDLNKSAGGLGGANQAASPSGSIDKAALRGAGGGSGSGGAPGKVNTESLTRQFLPVADQVGKFSSALSGAAGPMVAVAAAATLSALAMNKTAAAMEIMNNKSTTNAQKMDALVQEFVPFGSTLIRFREALDGTAEAIRKSKQHFQFETQRSSLSTQYRMDLSGHQVARDQAVANAGAARQYNYQNYDIRGMDRTTLSGQIQAEEYGIRFNAQRGVTGASRDLMAAQNAQIAQQRRTDNAVAAAQRAGRSAVAGQGERAAARAVESDPLARNRAGVEISLNNSGIANQRALDLQKEAQAEILRLNEANLKTEQSRSQVQKAIAEQMKAEAQILENRASRMTSQASSLGYQTRAQRMMDRQAVDIVRAHKANGGDIQDLNPETVSAAARGDRSFVDRLALESGQSEARDRARNGYETYSSTFGDGRSIQDVQRQAASISYNASAVINADVDALADRLARSFQQALDRMQGTLQDRFRHQIDSVTLNIQRGAAAPGGR